MKRSNKQQLLVSRPVGEPAPENFRLVEVPLPELDAGQVLVRHHFLSLDPYMRGRMNADKSYAAAQPLDAVMIGATAGEVIETRSDRFRVGDRVVGMGGWQQYQIIDAAQTGSLRKVDTTRVPLSAYLGAVGMPGVTAWYGLSRIIAPRAGETLLVSAASGAVGSVVGQLAKMAGAYVVGVAGGAEKCRYVREELGFDACVDYRPHADAKSLAEALRVAAPRGIDGHFENVGGMVLDAMLLHANAFARVALCGMISGYNGEPIPIRWPALILVNRMKIEGFIVADHLDVWPQALKELQVHVAAQRIKFRESVAEGIEAAPQAFLGLLKGRNFGKQLVKLV
jgi:NADPH-dependent curcumin reductase CurA